MNLIDRESLTDAIRSACDGEKITINSVANVGDSCEVTLAAGLPTITPSKLRSLAVRVGASKVETTWRANTSSPWCPVDGVLVFHGVRLAE